jgi:hypothetical protein
LWPGRSKSNLFVFSVSHVRLICPLSVILGVKCHWYFLACRLVITSQNHLKLTNCQSFFGQFLVRLLLFHFPFDIVTIFLFAILITKISLGFFHIQGSSPTLRLGYFYAITLNECQAHHFLYVSSILPIARRPNDYCVFIWFLVHFILEPIEKLVSPCPHLCLHVLFFLSKQAYYNGSHSWSGGGALPKTIVPTKFIDI